MEQQQPASSRSSFSDYPSAVSGPVPIFDQHLRFISDSYLAFFQERCVESISLRFATGLIPL
jgi:hypothetical protein